MLALSLAPAASPERESHQADPALATEIAPDNELPFVAGGVELDHALDLGVDSVPLE